MIEFPAIYSKWKHTNGNLYRVLAIANKESTRLDEYPITVVYQNEFNGSIWSRKLSDWYRSMTEI